MDLVQHPALCKEQCLCFYMTCPELGINLDGVSVVLESVLRHEKRLEPMLQWINTAGLISKLVKCHFRQAKLSPRVQNFSIMTENRARLGLGS